MKTTAFAFLLASASLLAQTPPSLDLQGGRHLVLLDARRLLPTPPNRPAVRDPLHPEAAAGLDALAEIAAFARHFATPAFGDNDDLAPLGGRYLAVLAPPEQCAAVEQMLQTAIEKADKLLLLEMQLMQVPDAAYAKVLQPLFPAGPRQGERAPAGQDTLLLANDADKLVAALTAAGCEVMAAPKVSMRPLNPATVSVVHEIAYVRDYTVKRNGDRAIANPIVSTVKDGAEMALLATFASDTSLAVDCRFTLNQVQRPLLESSIDLGTGAPVKVQLPRVTTVKLSQQAIMPLGQTLLLSAPRAEGGWLCALVKVSAAE